MLHSIGAPPNLLCGTLPGPGFGNGPCAPHRPERVDGKESSLPRTQDRDNRDTVTTSGLHQTGGPPPRPCRCPAGAQAAGDLEKNHACCGTGGGLPVNLGLVAVGALAVSRLGAQDGQRLIAGPQGGQGADSLGPPERDGCALARGGADEENRRAGSCEGLAGQDQGNSAGHKVARFYTSAVARAACCGSRAETGSRRPGKARRGRADVLRDSPVSGDSKARPSVAPNRASRRPHPLSRQEDLVS